jgi:hypothetical protein
MLATAGCEKASSSALHLVDPATQEMAALLRHQSSLVDPVELAFYVNDQRATYYRSELEHFAPSSDRLAMRMRLATELINSGAQTEAELEIGKLEEEGRQLFGGEKWRASSVSVLILKAIVSLRRAELENCCQLNNRDSCLLPIQGDGIHKLREGSTSAITILSDVLTIAPDNLRARWLLNIAYMTLGGYPDKIPPAYLIPPSAFASGYPLKRFPNVAKEVGLDIFGLAGGAILDDFDLDGRLDLIVSSIGFADQMRLFLNTGRGTFEDKTAVSGLDGETGGLNMIQADYDNDGLVDVLVLRGGWMEKEGRFPLSLLRNKGGGTFTDVTRAAGLLRFDPTQTATWLDYDGDGWLDLFVGNESSKGAFHVCQLFHSNRNGTFTDVAQQAGVNFSGFVKGVMSGDYDNDGRPDLYLSVLDGDNVLYHNEGLQAVDGQPPTWRFKNVAATAGVTAPRASFGTFFFDYDNDGWEDLFVVGYSFAMAEEVAADYLGLPTNAERGRLYHNQHDGTFRDVTQAAGLYKVIPAMGINFGDLDNDGWLDLYLGTGNPDLSTLIPNRMFRNAEGRFFQDVTTAGDFGHLQKGHAVCFGDVDDDGDQDVFENLGGAVLADKAHAALFENPGSDNHWLGLELHGVQSNRSAIGARIKVNVETKAHPRMICRVVNSGGSFGASPLRREIGLGAAVGITSVEVFWPATGRTQRFEKLELDKRYRITEGSAEAAPIHLTSFALATSASSGNGQESR